eukprot:gene10047-13506_t
MMIDISNKENVNSVNTQKQNLIPNDGNIVKKKQLGPHVQSCQSVFSGPALTKKRTTTFSSLLKEATDEVKVENDSRIAKDIQNKEAAVILAEWFREEADMELAIKLSHDYEEELLLLQAIEDAKNECEAMKVAVEERRRLKSEAEAKEEMVKNDEKLAQELAQRLIDEEAELRCLCARDEELAKRLADFDKTDEPSDADDKISVSYSNKFSDEKDDKCINPLLTNKKQVDKCDSKEEMKVNCYEEKEDFRAEDMKENAIEKVSVPPQVRPTLFPDQKTTQSFELSLQARRREYQRNKRSNIKNVSETFPTPASIAKQWEVAEADVEDVFGGVCISLLLPKMKSVRIRTTGGGKKILIDALRLVDLKSNNNIASLITTENNSLYKAQFILQGDKVNIMEEDVSFDYDIRKGLLHVYVDSVQLNENDLSDDGSKASASTASKFIKQELIKAYTKGYSRLFGKNNS